MNILQKISNINIKENHFYFFTFFWGYGIYAAGTDKYSDLANVHIFFPVIILLIISIFNRQNEIIFEFKEIIEFFTKDKNYIFFFIILFLLFFLSWEKISLSVTDDENAYISLGLVHSNILIEKISNKFEILNNFKISTVIQLISLLIIIGSIVFFLILKIFSKNKFFQILILSTTIIIFRISINNFGGNIFPHPPFIGLPALFSVSVFGLSNLVLKLSHFIIFSLFAYYIFLKLKKENSSIISLIVTISLFSIPGILYLGISYEQSLWSMICYTLILFETRKDNINYKKIFIIILIFSFFRILSLISLALIFFYILYRSKSVSSFYNEIILTIKSSYTLLIVLPFILFSFFDRSNITVDRVGFEFLNYNFLTYKLPKMLFDSYFFYAGSLILLSLLVAIIFLKQFKLMLSFITVLVIIYSNVVLANSKYLYEIFFPLLIFVIVSSNLKLKKLDLKKYIITLIILLLPINIFLLKGFKNFCLDKSSPFNEVHKYEVKYGCWFHDNHPFDLKKAYNFLEQQDNFSYKNLYVPGVYYGILPSIINGMQLDDLKEHKFINKNQNKLNLENDVSWISASAKIINSDPKIKYVLIADMLGPLKLEKDLINIGWKKIYNDIHKSFLTKITVLYKAN